VNSAETETTEYQSVLDVKARQPIVNKNIKEVAGNLFEAPANYTIGQCVSQDF